MKEDKNRSNVKNAGWFVYVGAIVVAWAFTVAMFTLVFKGNLFMQIVITIGVTFVSGNAVVMANALHFYAVDGWHRGLAIALYSLDIIAMILNVIASAAERLGNPPAWVVAYQPYSYATIAIPLISWAVLWIFDPYHKADVEKQRAKDAFVTKVLSQATALIDSDEGKKIVAGVAASIARDEIMNGKNLGLKEDVQMPVSTPASANIEKILEKAGLNGQSKEIAREIIEANPTLASIRK